MIKRIFYTIVVILYFTTISKSQDSIQIKINDIRTEFNKIQSNLKNCKRNLYNYSDKNSIPANIKFEAFYLPHGRLVKLVADINFNESEHTIEYYCKQNAVFFIFLQKKQPTGTVTQERIYFDDNQNVIRDIVKEKKVGDSRDFSKIPDENKQSNWPEIKYINGHAFYGDEIIHKYFSYPAFENCNDNDLKIKRIKEEYDKIVDGVKSGILTGQNVHYSDSIAYWNNTGYTAYYDKESKLVLLKYAVGEEGYYSENEIYFKNRKPFFSFETNTEPDDSQSQLRIYIYNDKIVNCLIKKKSPNESKEFSEIEDKVNNEIMIDVDKSSENLLNGIETEVWRLFDGFEVKNDK